MCARNERDAPEVRAPSVRWRVLRMLAWCELGTGVRRCESHGGAALHFTRFLDSRF
jgi:hypothetical protein